MSWSDVAIAAVAVACFNLLWWCLSLARRLGHIERTTKTDPLTGLGSGHWLETERWPAALRSGLPLCVVYLDLDHLNGLSSLCTFTLQPEMTAGVGLGDL